MYVLRAARDFSTVDDLWVSGALLVNTTVDKGIFRQHVVFPDLNFTCNGTINAVRFLAQRSHSDILRYPDILIGLGSQMRNSTYSVTYHSTSQAMNGIWSSGIEFEIKKLSIHYHTGEAFAMYHDLPLLHQMRKIRKCTKDQHNHQNHDNHPMLFECNDQEVYEPVLTINTGI